MIQFKENAWTDGWTEGETEGWTEVQMQEQKDDNNTLIIILISHKIFSFFTIPISCNMKLFF